MYNRLAAPGATVIENESANNTGKFPVVKMQRTGHAVRSETRKFIELIVKNRKNSSRLAFIPIHGDRHQLANTAKVIREAGGEPSICYNSDKIKVWAGGTRKLEETEPQPLNWIAVQEDDLSGRGNLSQYTYTLIDENFTKVKDLFVIKDANTVKGVQRDYMQRAYEQAKADEENFYVPSRREKKIEREKLSRKKKKSLQKASVGGSGDFSAAYMLKHGKQR